MSSSTRCEPRFPWGACLVDASVLVRFEKCGAFDCLCTPVKMVLSSQVASEFKKLGPGRRAMLSRLNPEVRPIRPGSSADGHLARLRGGRASNRDLGEDQAIALALEAREGHETLPLVVFDGEAARRAKEEGIPTLDFLDLMSWLVGCALTDPATADDIVRRAGQVDGWRPPADYGGSIASVRSARQAQLVSPRASPEAR